MSTEVEIINRTRREIRKIEIEGGREVATPTDKTTDNQTGQRENSQENVWREKAVRDMEEDANRRRRSYR